MVKPYIDVDVNDNQFIRTFDEDVPEEELIWHRDYYSRSVTVLETGPQWYFQLDGNIPQKLEEGGELSIDAKTWHRILKGTGKLVLEIREHGKERKRC